MKLLIFSDIHADWRALERLLETDADAYFAAGDLTNFSRGLEEAGRILARRAGRMYVLPGNHESEQAIDRMCRRHGLRNFHGGVEALAGWQVAGLGYSNPTPFDTPGEYSEEELAARLAKFEGLDPLVLICHAPPWNTPLDQARGAHFGSTAVAAFLARVQPRYFFCGHIHEAAGVAARLGATEAVNVGKKGYLLEL